VAEPVLGADGIVLNSDNELAIVSNANKALVKVTTTDNWETASVTGSVAVEYTFPTTGVFVNGTNYVLNAKLNEIFDPNTPNTSNFLIQAINF